MNVNGLGLGGLVYRYSLEDMMVNATEHPLMGIDQIIDDINAMMDDG